MEQNSSMKLFKEGIWKILYFQYLARMEIGLHPMLLSSLDYSQELSVVINNCFTSWLAPDLFFSAITCKSEAERNKC